MAIPIDIAIPSMFSVWGACRYAGISRSRLYVLISEGKVDARKIGGRTIITRASLDSLLSKLPRATVTSNRAAHRTA